MKYSLSGTVCALALFCASVPLATATFTAPAHAQYMQVSFESFRDELSRYGDWVYSDRWGPVWLPNVGSDFHPYYSNGYWANTIDYGWTWISDDPWGEITYHYGRWVDDPYDGWMWIPGYVWGPAWVVWRSNADTMGWMPMPPDRDFISGSLNISGGGLRFAMNFNDADDYYGYRSWYGSDYNDDRFARTWVFVDFNRFGDRDFRRYARPRENNYTFIRNTTNITNYTVVNNIIVNRSVDQRRFNRDSARRFEPVRADRVLRNPGRVTRVDEGRRVQQATRERIPQGRGEARSAPRPTEAVANVLSDRTPERRGRASGRLQTRQDVQGAGIAERGPNAQRDEARGQQRSNERAGDDRERAGQDRMRGQREAQDRQAAETRQRQNQEQLTQQRQQQEQNQERVRGDRERQDRERGPQMRQEQERFAQQRERQQEQKRVRGERQRQDQDRMQQQRQAQDQARAQQQQPEQAQRQDQMRQQQEQARAQQMQQRQQQDQARAQQGQMRQQQEQARAQQQQQRQQEQQARAQQQQQQPQEQTRGRQQREEQRAQRNDDGNAENRGRGRGRDRD